MAITYQINNTTIRAGIQAQWQPLPTGKYANGTQRINAGWYQHIWTCKVMEMTEWETIRALRGTTLTQLQVGDLTTENAHTSYDTNVRLMTASGVQRGRRMENVKIVFLLEGLL